MSWITKSDYCGFSSQSMLSLKSVTSNVSGQYLEKAGHNGDIAATKAFGETSAPSCEYAIVSAGTLSNVKLGAVTTVSDKAYALESIHYENGADSEPVFTATARQIEDGAATQNYFTVPDLAVDTDEIAAPILSAFTLSGTGCELVKCSADISCSVKVHTVAGDAVASDVTMGHIQVQATIGQYGTDAPSITPGTGWDVSSPLSCTDPDADMPSWTVTLSKPLEKTVASSAT